MLQLWIGLATTNSLKERGLLEDLTRRKVTGRLVLHAKNSYWSELALKTLTSLNKESRPFGDNRVWSFPTCLPS